MVKQIHAVGVAHPAVLAGLERTSELPLDKRAKRRFYRNAAWNNRRRQPRGRLYVSPSGVAFLGQGLSNEPHKHFTASISLALEGTLRVRATPTCRGKTSTGSPLCPTPPSNSCRPDAVLLNLQVDPETEAYALGGAPMGRPSSCCSAIASWADWRAALQAAAVSSSPGVNLWSATLDALGGPATDHVPSIHASLKC